jgi:(2Fe-2S) ferredoxin
MKTVHMNRTFEYRPRRSVIVVYEGGRRYERVPEAAVRAIVEDSAGEIVKDCG